MGKTQTTLNNVMTNPDQLLLRQFASSGEAERRLDSSPFLIALGCEVRFVDCDAGVVDLRFSPGPQFLQGAGVLQGGAVTSMLDFAMGFAGLVCVPPDHTIATANLTVAFLRAARMGTYQVRGEVERRGRTLVLN